MITLTKAGINKYLFEQSFDGTKSLHTEADYLNLVNNLVSFIKLYFHTHRDIEVFKKHGGGTEEQYIHFLILYNIYSFVGPRVNSTIELYFDVFKNTRTIYKLPALDSEKLNMCIMESISLFSWMSNEYPHIAENATK